MLTSGIFFQFQGSSEFVTRYLVPKILRKYGQASIGGTFIADTVMNLNNSINSQQIPKDWDSIDSYTSSKIRENQSKGDFMAVVQRRQPDAELVSVFSKHWDHLQADKDEEKQFKIRPFRIDFDKKTPSLESLTDHVFFVRSDHSRFWFVNETDYDSLPAILLTDTGPLRGKMAECYHQACDSVRSPYEASFADMDFYVHFVQTLLNTMLEVSKSQCLNTDHLTDFYEEDNNGAMTSKGSFLSGSLLTLADFIRKFMPW